MGRCLDSSATVATCMSSITLMKGLDKISILPGWRIEVSSASSPNILISFINFLSLCELGIIRLHASL